MPEQFHESNLPKPVQETPLLPSSLADVMSVEKYVATLVHEDELSELILQLEDAAGRSPGTTAPHVRSTDGKRSACPLDTCLTTMIRHTALNPHDRKQVQQAILTLGSRLERLRTVRSSGPQLPSIPRMDRRDAKELTEDIAGVLDAARWAAEDPDTIEDFLHIATDEAIEAYQQNLPPRSDTETLWWELARAATHDRMVPGFVRAADQLKWLEDSYMARTLVRSPWLLALLVGLLGLVTWFMPVPTPLVMIVLGLIGGFVVHPVAVERALAPLNKVKATFQTEIESLERTTAEDPWPEDAFLLGPILGDLLTILEGERLAGHANEPRLRLSASRYFERIAPHFAGSSGRGERYFIHLRDFGERHVVRRFLGYADARGRLEARPFRLVLDSRGLTAFLTALVTLPIAWLAARISPFPLAFDLPLMVILFLILGWHIPQMVEGSQTSLEALKEELSDHQGKLDILP